MLSLNWKSPVQLECVIIFFIFLFFPWYLLDLDNDVIIVELWYFSFCNYSLEGVSFKIQEINQVFLINKSPMTKCIISNNAQRVTNHHKFGELDEWHFNCHQLKMLIQPHINKSVISTIKTLGLHHLDVRLSKKKIGFKCQNL